MYGLAMHGVKLRAKRKALARKNEALVEEVNRLWLGASSAFNEEKSRYEAQVKDVVELQQVTHEKYNDCRKALDVVEQKLVSVEHEKKELLGQVQLLEKVRENMEKELLVEKDVVAGLSAEVSRVNADLNEMKSALAAVPSKESVIEEFRGSAAMGEIIRDGVEKFKCSEEFKREMEHVLTEYKAGDEFRREIDVAVANYYKGTEFKKIVAAESGRSTPHIVECCREFFKDDLARSRDEFGRYFIEWNQKMAVERKRAAKGSSSRA